jgi:hypothetical protein
MFRIHATLCAAALVLLSAAVCRGQGVPPAPAPLPGDATTLPPIPLPPVPPEPPPAPLAAPAAPADLPSAWFGVKEVDAVKPEIVNRLTDTVFVGGVPNTVSLAAVALNWTPAARIEAGYRLPDNAGELLASATVLDSHGSTWVTGFDPAGGAFAKSRVDLMAFDFDYGSRFLDLDPAWDVRGRIGIRFASLFMDTRVQGPVLGQRTSDYFFGVGPHGAADVYRKLGASAWSLFGRAEGAILIGKVDQNYEETFSAGGVPFLGGASRLAQGHTVPTLRAQAGLRWTPWPDRPFAVSAGYVFGGWWHIGPLRGAAETLIFNGLFLRGEWAF